MTANKVRNTASAISLLAMLVLTACQSADPSHADPHEGQSAEDSSEGVSAEQDEIFTLLALAVALKDWQPNVEGKRGYNIGAVLVGPDRRPVHWARNCNHITGNGTQHAELRLVTQYLETERSYNLKEHVVYSTLEPCAQCAGVILMQRVARVVYAQSDLDFGRAMERLGYNARPSGGLGPYPRLTPSVQSGSPFAKLLDEAAARSGENLTDWLHSDEAREIYARAERRLRAYEVRYEDNIPVRDAAVRFLEEVVTSDYEARSVPR